MLTSFKLVGVATLFIWCGNGANIPVFRHYTLAHDHFNQLCSNEGKKSQHRFCLMKLNRHYVNALCHFGPCHAYKQKV